MNHDVINGFRTFGPNLFTLLPSRLSRGVRSVGDGLTATEVKQRDKFFVDTCRTQSVPSAQIVERVTKLKEMFSAQLNRDLTLLSHLG